MTTTAPLPGPRVQQGNDGRMPTGSSELPADDGEIYPPTGHDCQAARARAFICECANDRRFERVEVAVGQWKNVAERTDYFLIVAWPPRVQGKQVIDRLGPFQIVCKANV